MSEERKQSLVITAYKGRGTADEVYHVLREVEKSNKSELDMKTAATVWRKDNGKLKLKHRKRVTVWKGGVGGGAIGLVLAGTGAGLLAGAVVGAVVGSSRAKQRRETKKFLDDKLGTDDSALVVLVNNADWAAVQSRVKQYGGEDLMLELTPEAEEQLAAIAADDDVAAAVREEVEIEEMTEE